MSQNSTPNILPNITGRFVKRLNKLLPFVAIGTIADCQSIIEPTNRQLVKAGLKVLEYQSPFAGLEELMKQTSLRSKMAQNYRLTSQDLAFSLSPILNSSGRISHARLSIAVLLSSNDSNPIPFADISLELENNPQQLANTLIATNQTRKDMVKEILQEVEKEAKAQVESGQEMIFLVGDWNKGIIGLLASRLVNQYDCPTIVVSRGCDL